MTLLRVLLSEAPLAGRADAWALYDDDGRLLREGRSDPAGWPRADRREAVIAAVRTRLSTLALPPVPPDRLRAAVAYALEDQLAAAEDPPRIAVGAPRADGSVDAAIAERALVEALAHASSRFARVVPEMALAPHGSHWTWYASAGGGGFVRAPSGAFAVDDAADSVPAEIAAAVAQAARGNVAPAEVRVAFECAPERLAQWEGLAGVPFRAVESWSWTSAPPARFATAPDWLAEERTPQATRADRLAWFRPAVVLAAVAFGLHVTGTLVEWLAYRAGEWRAGRDLVALAQAAGVNDATTPNAAVAALVQRHAEAQHRAGLPAPADALPLLALATPALADLPPATLKSAVYGGGAWTLELGRVEPARLEALDHALSRSGLGVLQAPTAAGARVRITALP